MSSMLCEFHFNENKCIYHCRAGKRAARPRERLIVRHSGKEELGKVKFTELTTGQCVCCSRSREAGAEVGKVGWAGPSRGHEGL